MNKNFAFSFIEVTIVLVIIGALSSLLLINFNQHGTNKNKILFKKAYYIAERTVYDIINDEDLYPTAGSDEGLKNTSSAEYNDNIYEGASKFCELFASKLNTIDKKPNCNYNHDFSKEPSFVTTDGIAWYMPVFDLKEDTDGDKDAPAEYHIWIDVNNKDGVNSLYSKTVCETDTSKESYYNPLNLLFGSTVQAADDEPSSNCHEEILTTEPDRFVIKVLYNGKMYVDGVMEKKYLQSNSANSK